MTRKNIFELLSEKYDIVEEINKIKKIAESYKICYDSSAKYTIETAFNLFFIYKWKARGSFLDCDEIKRKIGMPEYFNTKDIEDISIALEYYMNIVYCITIHSIKKESSITVLPSKIKIIIRNIAILADALNLDRIINEEEETVILVPKNPAATAVAEIAPKTIAFAILKYNHASLKGQLEEKRKLLASIANEYEPLLDNPTSGFSDYFTKTNALLNNLHIRHNNKKGKHKNEVLLNMKPEELEKWYDELYQLLLFCVLVKDNTARKEKVVELLKGLKN